MITQGDHGKKQSLGPCPRPTKPESFGFNKLPRGSRCPLRWNGCTRASDQAQFLWAHNNVGFMPVASASGPLASCPQQSSRAGKVICQFHCPWGMSLGRTLIFSLWQEVSSWGNASSPKYLDAQNRYIVFGSPEQSSETLL